MTKEIAIVEAEFTKHTTTGFLDTNAMLKEIVKLRKELADMTSRVSARTTMEDGQ